MRKILFGAVCITGFCLLIIGMTWGAEVCVDPGGSGDYTSLQAALTAAQSNGEDDVIKVVQGTYNGHFSYTSDEGHSITLLGGYTTGCAGREVDPANTILDGGTTGGVLSLANNSIGGNVYVEGFILQHGGGASTYYGAGLFAQSRNDLATGNMKAGDITIIRNIVTENNASTSGGGIYADSMSLHGDAGKVTVADSIVSNNTSTLYAGGVYVESYAFEGTPGTLTVTNNIVAGNSAGNNGGGIYATSETSTTPGGVITVTNNTVTGNSGDSGGGAFISAYNGSSGGIVNCYNNIIRGNTAATGGDIRLASSGTNNGYNNNYDNTKISGTWTNSGNNINADPFFVGDNDYHLRPSSSCIDAGNNAAPSLPSFDIEGYPRVMDGNYDGKTVVDMGALEYQSNVACAASAGDLQQALTDAESNGKDNTIMVVQGTYPGNFNYISSGGRSLTLLGGYTAGCAQRVVDSSNTILEGTGQGGTLYLYSDHGGDIRVDGFTVRNGYTGPPGIGSGGIFAYSRTGSGAAGNITLTNNTVTNNTATDGGGIYADSYADSGNGGTIAIVNNIISGNVACAGCAGGGVSASVYSSVKAGAINLINNTITGNTAGTGGGGIIIGLYGKSDGEINCYNNIVWNNDAPTGKDIYLGPGVASGYNNLYANMDGSWTNQGSNFNGTPEFIGGGDYHLQVSSPCIDAGDNSAPGLLKIDLDGGDRIVNGGISNTVDIGADEYTGLKNPNAPSSETIYKASTLINKYQPSFQWGNDGTYKSFTIYFSISPTDFSSKGILIAKVNVKGTLNTYTPSLGTWKKIMTASNNAGTIRDIYWKVVGIKQDKSTVDGSVRHFRIDEPLPGVAESSGDEYVFRSGTPPTFTFGADSNVKLQLEISSVSDFSDSKKIKKFIYTDRDPNVASSFQKTLSLGQWKSIIKLIGAGTGYFRVRAWDGIKRETVSEASPFIIGQ
jgi:predicted outer membrane repeat protein